ncbi:MAG: glycosyltransferase [Halieaceae bacterium]|nr:glycosyltransferase [Halieaceae bacterium]
MARILFLTQVLPYPLNAGPKIRAYHMLRHLGQRHELTLVSFVRHDDTPEAIEHLRGLCEAVWPLPIKRSLWLNARAGVKGLSTGLPMVIVRDEMPEMISLLRRLTSERAYQVVHADQTSMAGYGQLAAGAATGIRPRTLLDQHNAVHVLAERMARDQGQPWLRYIMSREARAFARFESAMCHAYDAILTVTHEDQERLLDLFPSYQQASLARKFTVVPISVDPAQTPAIGLDRHRPHNHAPSTLVPNPTILHMGTMFWPPNVQGVMWFATEVLPLIRRNCPTVRFQIVGKNPPPEIQALAAGPGIEVSGYVEDPTPYIEAADAFVVPLHAGSGMRVKILDVWLWGLPIVATTLGAEGIDLRPGSNILLADRPQDFAAATLRLLSDDNLNHNLRAQGRAWVEAHYSYQVVYAAVDRVYDKLLAAT